MGCDAQDSHGRISMQSQFGEQEQTHNGIYLHTHDNQTRREKNFQGFGRFLTGSNGEFYFRTIKPVAYGSRTPHIHFAVKIKGREKWTTQCYIRGESKNEKDRIYLSIPTRAERESVTVDFAPVEPSRINELAARFDIVLGITPEV